MLVKGTNNLFIYNFFKLSIPTALILKVMILKYNVFYLYTTFFKLSRVKQKITQDRKKRVKES